MAYADIAALQIDPDFSRRTMAAYAQETLADQGNDTDPGSWQAFHSWDMASQPGFGEAYASALVNHPDEPDYRPGNDPAVITDGQILSAVQGLLPQPEPDPEPIP